jgi:Ca2+-binding EF-hand superfamily protein
MASWPQSRSRAGGALAVSRVPICLAACLAAAGCSTSGPSLFASAPPVEREFALAAITWDLNKDGNVSCEEWKQYVTRLFREADANRDGILTREEYAQLTRRDRLFETVGMNYFDANADGRLGLAEMTDKPNPAFALLDKNGDCMIASDERVQPQVARQEPPGQAVPAPTGRQRRQ